MDRESAILVTGANGMLGRAIVRRLKYLGYLNLLTPSRNELNLLNELQVEKYICFNKPAYVFHLASTVFGLKGNLENQFKSLEENTKIYGYLFGAIGKCETVKKVFFAGTVASYPYPFIKFPLEEESFFSGMPHYGEFGYAMAKRHAYAYLKILQIEKAIDYVYGLLTNLYGENDTFDDINGHVIPSLIKKAVQAKRDNKKTFTVWGSPDSERDFLYVEDAAAASIFLMENFSGICNIATGTTTSIQKVANYISQTVGEIEPVWDSTAPVGIDKRAVSARNLEALGFAEFSSIEESLAKTTLWFMEHTK